MNIYVGNLAAEVTNEDLEKLFSTFGRVDSGRVITEKFSNVSRGFGFVEMGNNAEAKAAIEALGGTDLKGRTLVVNEAQPRKGGGGGGGRFRR